MTDMGPTSSYYVRSNGRIIGPLPHQELTKLFERGKLNVYCEVSLDRTAWKPISSLGERFAPRSTESPVMRPPGRELAIPPAVGTVVNDLPPLTQSVVIPTLSRDDDVSCFCSVDGQVSGPFPFSSVKELARIGRLSPHDRVWLAGTVDWVEASAISELTFPTALEKSAKWTRRSPVLVTCLILTVLVLVVVPIVLVVGMARQRAWRASEIQRLALERDEREEAIQRDRIARLNQQKQDIQSNEERLLNQRNQLVTQLNQLLAQRSEVRIDAAAQRRISALESDILDIDSELDIVRAELAGKLAALEKANSDLEAAIRESLSHADAQKDDLAKD